jgi:hypothetical protein
MTDHDPFVDNETTKSSWFSATVRRQGWAVTPHCGSVMRRACDSCGRRLCCALVCWLSGYVIMAAGESPKPKMIIPALFAEAQVSADGKQVVLVAATNITPEEVRQPQVPGELRIIDMGTGRTTASRAVPQAFLIDDPDSRRALTPDARLFGWLDNDRWLVVSRVVDSQEVHRADLNALGLQATSCVDGMWISDDGTFIITKNRGRGSKAWVRIELDPTPRVAATLPTSRRNDILGVRMAGDGEHGRIAMIIKRKRDFYLVLMDMKFQKLTELSLPRVERTSVSEMRTGSYPMILMANAPGWMAFSADADTLSLWRSGGANQLPNSTFVFGRGAVSPDGQYLAIAMIGPQDRALRCSSLLTVWSLGRGRLICQIPFDEITTGYRFDARGQYLSMCDSQNVYVWDFAELLAVSDNAAIDASR